MSALEVHRAARIGWEAGLRGALEAGENPNAIDPGGSGDQPLHYAAEGGHTACVGVLLDAGACPTARTWHGYTPLHHAASGGHEAVLRCLLARGADCDAPGRFARTPLHAALPHPRCVQLLLDTGADVEAADKKGWTPLHWCAADGHATAAGLLIERGADLEAAGSNGWTPLHLAANNARADLVRLLLDAGADALATGLDDKTPCDAAATPELRALLREAAARSDGFAQGAPVGADAAPEPSVQRRAGAPAVPPAGNAGVDIMGDGRSGAQTRAAPPPEAPVTPLLSPTDPSVVASAMFEALGLRTPAFFKPRA
jgi:hypothetical protein